MAIVLGIRTIEHVWDWAGPSWTPEALAWSPSEIIFVYMLMDWITFSLLLIED